MNKKRIAAIIMLVLITLLYIASLIFALIDSPLAKSCLMAAMFFTIVVPVVAYVYMRLIHYLNDNKKTNRPNI